MPAQERRDLLEALCLAPGPPGGEDAVRRLVRKSLEGAGTLSHDRLGSVLCELPGASAGPRVVVDSHLDDRSGDAGDEVAGAPVALQSVDQLVAVGGAEQHGVAAATAALPSG